MKPNKGNNKKSTIGLISLILWALVLTMLFKSCSSSYASANEVQVEYSVFRQWVVEELVESVDMEGGKYRIALKDGKLEEAQAFLPPVEEKEQNGFFDFGMSELKEEDPEYVTTPPPVADQEILALMSAHGVRYHSDPVDTGSMVISMLLSYLLPVVIMVGAMMFLMRGISKGGMGGMGGMGGVGKANAKVYVEKSTGVTFRDVAGQDEAKESLQEIIDILHNPQKYTEIGAKLPKGALLVGPPGTGKTLLAKAVAGEANVPFFSISGSDFVEMFVGVGASRVRDLFKEAAKMAPCIIFIDEIDTIGKSRDNRMGGNDEREQTLNQLLAELDGFDPGKGVIVLGATNRPEVLDKALLRPGRFDRRITIDRPNLAGRLATLQVHTRKIRLSEDVDLNKIALATAGTVGADLANLVNEAALRAVRHGRRAVNQEDLLASFEFVIAGSEKKNSVLTEFERRLVAYHEVGHAMVAYKQKNAEPVQKITIVPHTEGSLGYTLLMPEEDKTSLRTREELLAQICVSMGGRAAEQVIMHTQTNGASQDIQEATSVARNMVAMYGMSEKFGMMSLASVRNQYLDGGASLDCAQDTAAAMDAEVNSILNTCYKEAVKVIEENLEDMHRVVKYLLEKETITGGEMVAIIRGEDPEKVEEAYASSRPKNRTLPGDIEPPARNIHIVSEKIEAPAPVEEEPAQTPTEQVEQPAEAPAAEAEKPEQPAAPEAEKPEDDQPKQD